jgi:hypothetical protein
MISVWIQLSRFHDELYVIWVGFDGYGKNIDRHQREDWYQNKQQFCNTDRQRTRQTHPIYYQWYQYEGDRQWIFYHRQYGKQERDNKVTVTRQQRQQVQRQVPQWQEAAQEQWTGQQQAWIQGQQRREQQQRTLPSHELRVQMKRWRPKSSFVMTQERAQQLPFAMTEKKVLLSEGLKQGQRRQVKMLLVTADEEKVLPVTTPRLRVPLVMVQHRQEQEQQRTRQRQPQVPAASLITLRSHGLPLMMCWRPVMEPGQNWNGNSRDTLWDRDIW